MLQTVNIRRELTKQDTNWQYIRYIVNICKILTV